MAKDPSTTAIDVHAHYFPSGYVAEARRLGEQPSPVQASARLTYSHPQRARDPMFMGALPERIAMMDSAGIETEWLSFSSPNLWHPDPRERLRLVRLFNDGILAACRSHPRRFKLLANVPLPFVAEAVAEIQRLGDEDDLVGYGICAYAGETTLDDPSLSPVLQAWDDRRSIVFLHPDRFSLKGLEAYGMEWGLGAPFDDTIVVLRLIRSGITTRYPNITWVVPHLGGTLPFLFDRLEQLGQHAGPGGAPLPPLDLSPFLFDVCTPSVDDLVLARRILGVDRLVLGTDFPYVERDDMGVYEQRLRAARFDDEEVAKVLRGNILRAAATATRGRTSEQAL